MGWAAATGIALRQTPIDVNTAAALVMSISFALIATQGAGHAVVRARFDAGVRAA